MREIKRCVCSCGGDVHEVLQTQKEANQYNCSRGCCGTALVCQKCKTRFVIHFEAPELEDSL